MSRELIGLALIVLGLAIIGVSLPCLLTLWRLNRRRKGAKDFELHITSAPAGEAPLWVREKWVGTTLPLALSDSEPFTTFIGGVLTGGPGMITTVAALLTGKLASLRLTGYVVHSKTALELLETHSAEAAAWWKQNAPQFWRGGYFVFDADCGFVSKIS